MRGRAAVRPRAPRRPRSTRSSFVALRDDERDVVGSAAVVRERDQRLDRRLPAGRSQHLGQDLLGSDEPVEAVGGDDEDVTLLHPELDDVRRHLWTRPQHPGDEVTPLVALGLVLAEEALLELLLDPGVVLGQLVDLLAAHEVGAGIADVADERRAVLQGHAREGRAHAAPALLLYRGRVHAPVRQPHGLVDELVDPDDGLARADLLDVTAERLVEDLHGQLAGDLARGGPAHAVGDGEEGDVPVVERELPHPVVVLVERSDPAYVRAVAHGLSEPHAGSLTRWTARGQLSSAPGRATGSVEGTRPNAAATMPSASGVVVGTRLNLTCATCEPGKTTLGVLVTSAATARMCSCASAVRFSGLSRSRQKRGTCSPARRATSPTVSRSSGRPSRCTARSSARRNLSWAAGPCTLAATEAKNGSRPLQPLPSRGSRGRFHNCHRSASRLAPSRRLRSCSSW